MKIRKISVETLAQREFYERDALAIVAGSEHYMDVVVVVVETDDGLVGYGESLCYGGMEAVATTVTTMVAPLIIGDDSNGIRGLWDKMYKATFRLGRRGIVIAAMSGIDMALWDLKGKELGAPVYKLLGGPKRRIKGYITGGYYSKDKDIPKLIDEVRSYVNQGFNTVKIKIGALSLKEDIKRIASIRQEFGDRIDIAVDANNTYDFNTAIKAGRELEKLDVIFFEEPIFTDHLDLSAELARSLDIPIAGYETAYTLYEFRDIVMKHAVDIVQADSAWNGGITEMLRIGTLARAYGFPIVPHYSAGGIGFVASLHTAAALDSPMTEYQIRPNPLREGLTGDAIKHEDGNFILPDKPGLGISIDSRVLEKYRM